MNILRNISSISRFALTKGFLYNIFLFNRPMLYGFCKVKLYITQFQNLQIKVKEQQQELKQITDTYNLLQNMSHMNIFDYIKKLGSSVVNSHKPFESSAYKHQQIKLINSRNLLERKIQQSSQRWEQPRNQIMQIREECVQTFLEDLINFQTKLLHLVETIRKIGSKNDKVKDVHQGIQLTHQILLKNLVKEGAQTFKTVPGVRFNSVQEYVDKWQQKSQQQKEQICQKGKIKQCLRYGWRLKQKIVRKAYVQLL